MPASIKRFVSTLVFSPSFSEVVLIKKKYGPPWLIGKHTGIGGNIEPKELIEAAGIREVKEESGLVLLDEDVMRYAMVERHFDEYITQCHMMVAVHPNIYAAESKTSEKVSVSSVDHISSYGTIPRQEYADDLPWLTQMAITAWRTREKKGWHTHQVIV